MSPFLIKGAGGLWWRTLSGPLKTGEMGKGRKCKDEACHMAWIMPEINDGEGGMMGITFNQITSGVICLIAFRADRTSTFTNLVLVREQKYRIRQPELQEGRSVNMRKVEFRFVNKRRRTTTEWIEHVFRCVHASL